MGLYLGVLTVWEQNLLPAIICHATFDFFALLVLTHRCPAVRLVQRDQ